MVTWFGRTLVGRMESVVNLVGALMALAMLTVAERPADEDHPFGHGKAEYFSSGVEGTLILIAALSIGVASVDRLISPKPLEKIGFGLAISIVASLLNHGVAAILRSVGTKRDSVALEANARHLLADVWTSVGVVAGVGLVVLTSWERLDPIIALAVTANIIWTGLGSFESPYVDSWTRRRPPRISIRCGKFSRTTNGSV